MIPLDVCLLRLDFETFSLRGAGATNAINEGVCLDRFTVTVGGRLTQFAGQGVLPPFYLRRIRQVLELRELLLLWRGESSL